MHWYNRLVKLSFGVLLGLVLALAALLPGRSIAQGPGATPGTPQPGTRGQPAQAGSTSQLRIDQNPLLGMNVMAPGSASSIYDSPVEVGGDVTIDAFGDCVGGSTTELATLGLAWVADSGPVDIQFSPTQQRGHPVGMLLWDVIGGQWWCTSSLSENNLLQFSNMSKGLYFLWVLTEDGTSLAGTLSVTSPPPLPGS